jgi:SAM-dependent methyltransferase
MAGPDVDFWQERFLRHHTPWDRGAPSPQVHAWLASGALSPGETPDIVVPGCGAGHEVALLAKQGFAVTALDYAPAALEMTREHLAREGAHASLEQVDVLDWMPAAPGAAVYEQTCPCALHPDRWIAYAARLHAWLRPGGRLFAVFMQAPRGRAADGFVEGPPTTAR